MKLIPNCNRRRGDFRKRSRRPSQSIPSQQIGTQSLKRPKNRWRARKTLLTNYEDRIKGVKLPESNTDGWHHKIPGLQCGLNTDESTNCCRIPKDAQNIFFYWCIKQKEKNRGEGHSDPRPFVKGSIDCLHLRTFVMLQYKEYCNEPHRDKSHELRDLRVLSR